MSAAQDTGTGAPDAQEYAGELGGFVLARSAVDRVSARRGDTEWLAAAWADPGTRVLVLDNARALVRFGDKEAELVLVPPAEAPEGLRFLLGVDDAGVAYFGVMGPPGCLESLVTDAEEPAAGGPGREPGSARRERTPGQAAARPGRAGQAAAGKPRSQAAPGQEATEPGSPRAGSPRARKPPAQEAPEPGNRRAGSP